MHETIQHRWEAALVSVPGAAVTTELLAFQIASVAHRRDRAAFAALFAHYAPRVKSYMLRQGASAAQAEDLAQETMLMVWRKAERFDPAIAGASTWVFTIARNLRIDALRRERPAADLSEIAEAASDSPGADAVMATTQSERGLRAALAALPEDMATLLRLSFFEDHAHGDISARLGMPLGTVKSKLRRAMLRLRATLEEIR